MHHSYFATNYVIYIHDFDTPNIYYHIFRDNVHNHYAGYLKFMSILYLKDMKIKHYPNFFEQLDFNQLFDDIVAVFFFIPTPSAVVLFYTEFSYL